MFGQIPAVRSDPFVPDLQAAGLPLPSVSMQQPGTQRGNVGNGNGNQPVDVFAKSEKWIGTPPTPRFETGRIGSQRCWDGASILVIWEAGLLKLRWSLGMRYHKRHGGRR